MNIGDKKLISFFHFTHALMNLRHLSKVGSEKKRSENIFYSTLMITENKLG